MNALEAFVGGMTVGELARRANVSVEQIVAAALCGVTASRSPPTSSEGTAGGAQGTVARGGPRLDHVLAALASIREPAKLDDVRGRTGGSVSQVRAALQKLAEAGKVKITGQRRGTRYAAR